MKGGGASAGVQRWMCLLIVLMCSLIYMINADAAADMDVLMAAKPSDNAKLQAENAKLQVRMAHLEDEVASARQLGEKVETLKKQLAEAKKEAEAVTAAAAKAEAKAKEGISEDDHQAVIEGKEAAEAQVKESEAAVNALKEEIDSLKGRLAAAEEKAKAGSAAEAELMVLKEEMADLEDRKEELESQVQDLEEELEEAQAAVAEAEKKTSEGDAALRKQVEALEGQIEAYKSQLDETIAKKYSAKVLSQDFVAGARKLYRTSSEHSRRGLSWAGEKAYEHSIKAKEVLDPHIETATVKLGELTRQASESAMPLVDEHVTPHYQAYVKPHVDTLWEKAEPVWVGTVRPKLGEGYAVASDLTVKGVAIASAEFEKGRAAAVGWINEQAWAEGNGEGIVSATLYILAAALLFLLRHVIFSTIKAILKLPFQVIYWSIFWPTLLFGSRTKKGKEAEDPTIGGAFAGSRRR